MTHYYLIESLSPLVFRAGKPFGAQAYQADANFPLPSSAAGLIRALYLDQYKIEFKGNNSNRATLSEQQYHDIKQQALQGLYLARLNHDGAVTVLVPKPADAIYLSRADHVKNQLLRLVPQHFELDKDEEYGSDLPQHLLPVRLLGEHKGKPQVESQFWSLDDLMKWQIKDLTLDEVKKNGLKHIPIEIRTHTAVDIRTRAAKESALFQTAGLDLGYQAKSDEPGIHHQGWHDKRLAFLIHTDVALNSDLASFGGERRLSHFQKIDQANVLPEVSKTLALSLQNSKGLRLTMLTPALFDQGYLPAWINRATFEGILPNSTVKVRLKAVAIDRWLAVSGWDLQTWKPKATRKAVAAGSVYWFEIFDGTLTQADIEQLWFKPLSDQAQDKLDGFGVVLPASWDA